MTGSIVDKVLAGDIRTVARLIRDIDDGMPEVRQYLKALYLHTGRAYVIGITGAPGVGKSTLVDQMIGHLRAREKTVGVLAVVGVDRHADARVERQERVAVPVRCLEAREDE